MTLDGGCHPERSEGSAVKLTHYRGLIAPRLSSRLVRTVLQFCPKGGKTPMAISKRKIIFMALGLFAFVGLSQIILEIYADARAGGGRSGGFRGSRSYSSPARPTQPSNPTAPSRETMPSQQPGMMAPQTGGVLSGSNSDPIQFEEYWTFSRPVGPNAWKLSAVQQA